jgi:hypothetical protein
MVIMIVLLGSATRDINVALGNRFEKKKVMGTYLGMKPDNEYQYEFRVSHLSPSRNVETWKERHEKVAYGLSFPP